MINERLTDSALARVLGDRLRAAYPEASEAGRTYTTNMLIQNDWARLANDGSVEFTAQAERIVPRLVLEPEPAGDDEFCKLKRASIRTARLQPLLVKPGTGLREALRAIAPLAPNATEQDKVQRASDVMAACRCAGFRGDDQ